MGRALWLADRCRDFGLNVVEIDGWQARGSATFSPKGVVAHHTADGPGEIGSLRVLVHGRSDLPGPLCNVGLGRSGTVYVIASGRANHAGSGGWKGLSGNSSVLGIEAENRGTAADPWPGAQLLAYHRLCAALITGPGVGGDVARVCGHKEWAPSRKVDPHSLDMNAFREKVWAVLKGEEDWFSMADKKDLEEVVEAAVQPLRDELAKVKTGLFSKNNAAVKEATGRATGSVVDNAFNAHKFAKKAAKEEDDGGG